jgi:putative addiction module component (TIGR02574 family)
MDSVILAKEVLQLTPFEKAQMIDALWLSLDPAEQESVDRAWLAESQDRLKAFRSGQIKAQDGDAAIQSIESELKR